MGVLTFTAIETAKKKNGMNKEVKCFRGSQRTFPFLLFCLCFLCTKSIVNLLVLLAILLYRRMTVVSVAVKVIFCNKEKLDEILRLREVSFSG